MMAMWVTYCILVAILLIQSNDFWFSMSLGAFLLVLFFWPVALLLGFVFEFIKTVTKK